MTAVSGAGAYSLPERRRETKVAFMADECTTHPDERSDEFRKVRGDQVGGSVSDAELILSELDESALLNGPDIPKTANSQDEIDALFASFD